MKHGISLFILALVLGPLPARADYPELEFDYPIAADRWGVGLGGYGVDLDTTVSVGIGDLVGTTIDVEDILGLQSDQSIVRLGGFFRIRPKHTLEFTWLEINRSSDLNISESFEFDGVRYDANAMIDSKMDMSLYKVDYQYSFFNNGRVNTGLQTGLSVFDFDAAIGGQGVQLDADGNPVSGVSFEETGRRLLAPVPGLGFFIDFAAYRWMVVRFSAEFLDLSISGIEGRYQDTSLLLEFRPQRHFAIGVGIAGTDLRVKQTGEDPWSVDYRFSGVVGYLGTSF
ncbi:MAG: hypothetical protein PVF68_07815 [Acidobacteriota bacterium]